MAAIGIGSNAGARPGSLYAAGFSATVTVAGPPSSISAPADNLRNDSGYPVLLDSIRLEASYVNADGFQVPTNALPFRVRVFKGRDNLTNEFVPLAAICKPHVRLATSLNPVGQQLYAGVEVGSYVWRFEKPVYMAPQEVISVDFICDSPNGIPSGTYSDGLAPYTVTVTGIGRVMPRATKAKDYPWLPFASAFKSGFNGVGRTSGGADLTPSNTIIASGAADLYNPKAGNLFVKDVLGYGETWASTSARHARVDVVDTNLLDLSISGTQVQIVNASAMGVAFGESFNIGIRDFAPFYHAFIPQDRSWHLNAVLSPQSYITATLALSQWGAVGKNAGITQSTGVYAQYVIGMIGYFKRGDV